MENLSPDRRDSLPIQSGGHVANNKNKKYTPEIDNKETKLWNRLMGWCFLLRLQFLLVTGR